MNKIECEVLNMLCHEPYVSQRLLASEVGCSLGAANKAVRSLIDGGYLDEGLGLTAKARDLLADRAPNNGIVLAAGVGMRMAPINMMQPKGMLEVEGELHI